MKDQPRQQFRNAAHVSGIANAKPKDYEAGVEVEADNEYAAWAVMRNSENPLNVGDLLEAAEGKLRICKYVGFEEARWFVPEQPSPRPGRLTEENTGQVSQGPAASSANSPDAQSVQA